MVGCPRALENLDAVPIALDNCRGRSEGVQKGFRRGSEGVRKGFRRGSEGVQKGFGKGSGGDLTVKCRRP
eukprot:2172894-Pyramimonas_sp.AAC.1